MLDVFGIIFMKVTYATASTSGSEPVEIPVSGLVSAFHSLSGGVERGRNISSAEIESCTIFTTSTSCRLVGVNPRLLIEGSWDGPSQYDIHQINAPKVYSDVFLQVCLLIWFILLFYAYARVKAHERPNALCGNFCTKRRRSKTQQEEMWLFKSPPLNTVRKEIR